MDALLKPPALRVVMTIKLTTISISNKTATAVRLQSSRNKLAETFSISAIALMHAIEELLHSTVIHLRNWQP